MIAFWATGLFLGIVHYTGSTGIVLNGLDGIFGGLLCRVCFTRTKFLPIDSHNIEVVLAVAGRINHKFHIDQPPSPTILHRKHEFYNKEVSQTVTGHLRGNPIEFRDNQWDYSDNGVLVTQEERPCVRCGKMPTPEGYDACLGYIEGATSACCGHGVEEPYCIKKGMNNHEHQTVSKGHIPPTRGRVRQQ